MHVECFNYHMHSGELTLGSIWQAMPAFKHPKLIIQSYLFILTHSVTPIHPLLLSLTHSLLFTHRLLLTDSLTHGLADSLTHSLTHSLTDPFTHLIVREELCKTKCCSCYQYKQPSF